MKMEVPVEAPVAGRLLELCVAEEDPVEEGQIVAILEH
jgi:biotin carboxyl carrier protein